MYQMNEVRPDGFSSKIELDIDRRMNMLPEEINFWETMANSIQGIGKEAPFEFSKLLLSAHQRGSNSIRDFIQAGKKRNTVTDFELELEKKIDLAQEEWCKKHKKTLTNWSLNLLDNNTDNIKGIFRVELV